MNKKQTELKVENSLETENEDTWLDDIIEDQEEDLFDEDLIIDKIPKKISAKYRDDKLES